MSTEDVVYDLSGPVGRIAINRPARKNSLTPDVTEAITRLLSEAAETPTLRALIFGSSENGFCSGADLVDSMQSIPRGEGMDLEGFIDKTYHAMIRALVNVPVPTIAAVRGGAVGFGMSLALACDFRIVANDAKMGAVFTRIGLVPDGGTSFFLGRLIGAARTMELIYTARSLSGTEANELGLCTEILADDAVEARAKALAEQLAEGPPGAFKEVRKLVYGNLDRDLNTALDEEARVQAERLQSADTAEGVMAFLQHRKPKFTGR